MQMLTGTDKSPNIWIVNSWRHPKLFSKQMMKAKNYQHGFQVCRAQKYRVEYQLCAKVHRCTLRVLYIQWAFVYLVNTLLQWRICEVHFEKVACPLRVEVGVGGGGCCLQMSHISPKRIAVSCHLVSVRPWPIVKWIESSQATLQVLHFMAINLYAHIDCFIYSDGT